MFPLNTYFFVLIFFIETTMLEKHLKKGEKSSNKHFTINNFHTKMQINRINYNKTDRKLDLFSII